MVKVKLLIILAVVGLALPMNVTKAVNPNYGRVIVAGDVIEHVTYWVKDGEVTIGTNYNNDVIVQDNINVYRISGLSQKTISVKDNFIISAGF